MNGFNVLLHFHGEICTYVLGCVLINIVAFKRQTNPIIGSLGPTTIALSLVIFWWWVGVIRVHVTIAPPTLFWKPLLQLPRDIEAMDIALWIKIHGPNNSMTFIYKPTTRGEQVVQAHLKHFLLIAKLEVVLGMFPILQKLVRMIFECSFHAMNHAFSLQCHN